MRKLFTFLSLLSISFAVLAQQPQPYYNDINFNQDPEELYQALQDKISVYNTSFNYGQVRDAMKIADAYENDLDRVVLIYGYDDNDNDCTTDYTRDKDAFGGQTCEYNREHVFPRSLAQPGMGTASNVRTGIVADPHNLRPADQKMNENRQNYLFGPGSGNAGTVHVYGQTYWYPGDEWKGDVARMMMYMYLRYGDQCLPEYVGYGDTMTGNEMLELFIQWNIEDPVNYLEIQRNDYLEIEYGNRNPFIDNPYLATMIWGGAAAEDRWDMLSTEDFVWEQNISIYPNPAKEYIWVETKSDDYQYTLYDILGKKVKEAQVNSNKTQIPVRDLNAGIYILSIKNGQQSSQKKIIVGN